MKALNLPKWVVIPDETQFSFISTNIFSSHDKYKLGESENLQNPNFGLSRRTNESIVSSDWLGIYQTIGQSRFIFIRIDEIMREPLLNNAIGVASVVIHELGHAIMDPRIPVQLDFRENLHPMVANLFRYVLEESLANWIAYHCINGSSPYENNVVEFMRTKQPFPYPLGVKFGEATSIKAIEYIRKFYRYIECWYKAKTGIKIENVAGWFRLILAVFAFTTADLRNQIETLFFHNKAKNNTKTPKFNNGSSIINKDIKKKQSVGISKLNLTDNLRLYPRVSDPFGRSGEEKDGVYVPFKFGFVNHHDEFVIPPIFDDAEKFSESIAPGYGPLAYVVFNGKTGILKPDGTYFIEPHFCHIRDFHEGLAVVSIDNGFYKDWGIIKLDGSYLVPPMFDRIDDFKDGYAKVLASSEVRGFIQSDGSYLLKSFSDIADSIENDSDWDDITIGGKRLNGKTGYIDINGHWHDEIQK